MNGKRQRKEFAVGEGNTAAMREALSDACYAMFNFIKTQNGGYEEMAKALDKAKAALAKPTRNCDVGSAAEQAERFVKHCQSFLNRDGIKACMGCPCCGVVMYGKCELAWAQMPYEKCEKKGERNGVK